MDSLRQLSSPTGSVIRNGESITVPAKFIVPGLHLAPLIHSCTYEL